MPTIDTESPPGSWINEWVEAAQSKQQLKHMIYEQQDRLNKYVKQIEKLEAERNEMIRWQVETTYMDMMQKAIIQRYKTALQAISQSKHSAECAAIAETALRPT
jgi:DNA repair exonuclease SbcCD ATPase subunit